MVKTASNGAKAQGETASNDHMKPTARRIDVGVLVKLVLSRETANVDIIHKPPEMRLANR